MADSGALLRVAAATDELATALKAWAADESLLATIRGVVAGGLSIAFTPMLSGGLSISVSVGTLGGIGETGIIISYSSAQYVSALLKNLQTEANAQTMAPVTPSATCRGRDVSGAQSSG